MPSATVRALNVRASAVVEAMIAAACARQPDAQYLLVQRVMQLEHALKDAMREAAQPKATFVGDANAWGRAPVARPARATSS